MEQNFDRLEKYRIGHSDQWRPFEQNLEKFELNKKLFLTNLKDCHVNFPINFVLEN